MLRGDDCPIGAIERAQELISQLKIGEIPVHFDPGQLRWNEILARIVEDFSNHEGLLEQLDAVLADAREELCGGCAFIAENPGEDYGECPERFLAEHYLRAAALDAAERAYQRWLARQALRRAAD